MERSERLNPEPNRLEPVHLGPGQKTGPDRGMPCSGTRLDPPDLFGNTPFKENFMFSPSNL